VVALSPNAAAAYGDLAAACSAEASALARSDPTAAAAAAAEAEASLIAALRIDPTDPALWTALGTLPLPPTQPHEQEQQQRQWARREVVPGRSDII